MNWVDITIIIIFAGVVLLEVKRGFGRVVFDLIALILAMRLAFICQDSLSKSIILSANPLANAADVYAISFLLMGAVLLFLGHMIYSNVLISADYLDPLLGGFLGLFCAMIICHAFVRTLSIPAGPDNMPEIVAKSSLGSEMLNFDTYHKMMYAAYHFNDRNERELQ